MSSEKKRLDVLLVERGLAPSRDAAQRIILAGLARVNDQPANKAGQRHAADARIEVVGALEPFVGRGGVKLQKALEHFHIDPSGAVALDIGASTGGFTDCLLQGGAAKVYAVDAGRNQLSWKLRSDSRVIVLEKVNARYLTEAQVPELADIVTVDVSFISVAKILDPVLARMKSGARIIVLAKPQFEAGPDQVGKGGIVRDEAVRMRVVDELCRAMTERGLRVIGWTESPITGADGNREYLIAAEKG
ncbi:MAG: TlyA family RNA methyltransferase [Candidatus Sumerlaeota bacterium]|nr:TlyA family RNA methyltransferase [Candidatus Sumerlaeota bacterium]